MDCWDIDVAFRVVGWEGRCDTTYIFLNLRLRSYYISQTGTEVWASTNCSTDSTKMETAVVNIISLRFLFNIYHQFCWNFAFIKSFHNKPIIHNYKYFQYRALAYPFVISWAPLLTYINFNPNMDNYLHQLWCVGWNYLPMPTLQRLNRWNFGMDK